MQEFHLRVKSVVDRILLFSNGDLIGEMEECVDETNTTEKIYNGFVDKEVDAVFLCYCLGEDIMEARDVFSLPLQTQPDDITSEYAPNSICINYYLPIDKEETSSEITRAKYCLVDIPERLQKGLGLPSLIILPLATLTENMLSKGADELKKRGVDIKAEGFFYKQIVHLWAKSDADAADFGDEKIKIGLFAHSITKHISV